MSLGKGEETLGVLCTKAARTATLQSCRVCSAKQGLPQPDWSWLCARKVEVTVKQCLREASDISVFSFSKLYVHANEADPERSSSPDLPSLHFAAPLQVSRSSAVCSGGQTCSDANCAYLVVSSVCVQGCLWSLHADSALLPQLPRVSRCILLLLRRLAAEL